MARAAQKQRPVQRIFTAPDAAAFVGCDVSVIHRALDTGQLEAHQLFGEGHARILEDHLVDWFIRQPRYVGKGV